MIRTITIKDGVFNRLSLQKGKDESFSDLFERLLDNQVSGIIALKTLRGSVNLMMTVNERGKCQDFCTLENGGGYLVLIVLDTDVFD